MAKPS